MADRHSIRERPGLGLATVMARRGLDPAGLDLELPAGPRCAGQGPLTLVGVGPGTWLAVSEAPEATWPEPLARRLAGHCSVSDQSGGYVVHRIEGEGAATLLQRGLAIDLHPAVFGAGAAATSVIAHIGVILWRPAAEAVFDLAVFRSHAASFRHWVEAQFL